MKKQGWPRWVFRIVRILLVGYGTLMIFACTVADRMIFAPPPPSYTADDDGVFRFGQEKEFAGFYLPADEKEAPVLLWGHGNAEDAGHTSSLARGFQARGVSVLVYDYPGYGLSEGKPSEKGCYRVAEEAYRYLVEEQKVSPERIFLLGQSVGGGPSTYLAEKEEAGGLILISPFKSTFRVITKVKILPWDRFDNWKRMPKVKMPLLLIHGDADGMIPFENGKALFGRHKGPKEFIALEGVGHNDLWPEKGEEVMAAVERFVRGED